MSGCADLTYYQKKLRRDLKQNGNLFEEEKKRENMGKKDSTICLKKRNKD